MSVKQETILYELTTDRMKRLCSLAEDFFKSYLFSEGQYDLTTVEIEAPGLLVWEQSWDTTSTGFKSALDIRRKTVAPTVVAVVSGAPATIGCSSLSGDPKDNIYWVSHNFRFAYAITECTQDFIDRLESKNLPGQQVMVANPDYFGKLVLPQTQKGTEDEPL